MPTTKTPARRKGASRAATVSEPAGRPPEAAEQAAQLLDAVEKLDKGPPGNFLPERFVKTPELMALERASPDVRAEFAVEALRRIGAIRARMKDQILTRQRGNLTRQPGYSSARSLALQQLFRKAPPLIVADWDVILEALARYEVLLTWELRFLTPLAAALKRHTAKHGVTRQPVKWIGRMTKALSDKVTSGFGEKKVIETLKDCANADPAEQAS